MSRMEGSDDDVLELRPSRTRWWVGGLVVALVVAATVGALVRNGHDRGAPHPLPSTSPVARSVRQTAVVVSGGTAVVLTHGRLQSQDVRTGRVLGQAPAPPAGPAAVIELAADPAAGLLWAVTANSVPARMAAYRLPGMQLVRRLSWPRLVATVAAMAGHLYVSTALGVADLAPGAARPVTVPGLYGAVGPVVADPARHRIIATDLGYPTDVWSVRPGGAPRQSPRPLRIADGTLAVVGGRIWIAGHDKERPVLWRLDPATLSPAHRARPDGRLGARVVLVAAGSAVLWLRGSDDLDGLYCADASGGTVRQSWRVRGAVDSVSGTAYADTADGLRTLTLTGCAG
jgi:hypothetical protein